MLALKGAQLNEPRGQKRNDGITREVKPFLPPEAKRSIFTVFRKKTKQSGCFHFKKQHTLLLIGVDHHHLWHLLLLLQKEVFSCSLSIITTLIFPPFNSCQLLCGYFYRIASLAEQIWSPSSTGAVWGRFQP